MFEKVTIFDVEYVVLSYEPYSIMALDVFNEMFDSPNTIEDVVNHPNCTEGMKNLLLN